MSNIYIYNSLKLILKITPLWPLERNSHESCESHHFPEIWFRNFKSILLCFHPCFKYHWFCLPKYLVSKLNFMLWPVFEELQKHKAALFWWLHPPRITQTCHIKWPVAAWLAGSWNCFQLDVELLSCPILKPQNPLTLWKLFSHLVILLKMWGNYHCLVIMPISLMILTGSFEEVQS